MHTASVKPGVAILTTYYRPVVGGVETAAESLATWLGERGHEVHVLTTRTARDVPAFERVGRVSIHRWPRLGRRRSWNKWLAVLPLAWAAWRLRTQVSLLFVVDFRATGLAARLVGRCAQLPIIFQAETDGAFEVGAVRRVAGRVPGGAVLASWLTWPLRRLYQGADLNIGISRAIVAEAIRAGWPEDRVVYLPHPVDRTIFEPASPGQVAELRRRLALPQDAVVVTFVGRLSREKGIIDLAHAWRGMPATRAHLVVVGPDMEGHRWDAGPDVRRLLATAPLPSTCVGGVSSASVAEYLRASDIVVLPSHFEAFGIAAAEGMSCGLPVVATDVGGFRDYVVDGRNGLLVPPRDPEALKRALLALIGNPDRRRAMGKAARADTDAFDRQVVFTQCESWIAALTR